MTSSSRGRCFLEPSFNFLFLVKSSLLLLISSSSGKRFYARRVSGQVVVTVPPPPSGNLRLYLSRSAFIPSYSSAFNGFLPTSAPALTATADNKILESSPIGYIKYPFHDLCVRQGRYLPHAFDWQGSIMITEEDYFAGVRIPEVQPERLTAQSVRLNAPPNCCTAHQGGLVLYVWRVHKRPGLEIRERVAHYLESLFV